MNVGNTSTITNIGSKGQIVVPSDFRKALGMNYGSLVRLVFAGNKVCVEPVAVVDQTPDDNAAFLALLKRYQGAWGPETSEEKRARIKQRKIELVAAKSRKNAW